MITLFGAKFPDFNGSFFSLVVRKYLAPKQFLLSLRAKVWFTSSYFFPIIQKQYRHLPKIQFFRNQLSSTKDLD